MSAVDVLAVMDKACELHANGAYADAWEVGLDGIAEARAAVAELIETLRMSAEALESAAKCVDGDLAVILRDRAMFARAALARVQGGA